MHALDRVCRVQASELSPKRTQCKAGRSVPSPICSFINSKPGDTEKRRWQCSVIHDSVQTCGGNVSERLFVPSGCRTCVQAW